MTAVEVEKVIGEVLGTVPFVSAEDMAYAKAVQVAIKARVPDALVEVYFPPGKLVVDVRLADRIPVIVTLELG